MRFNQPLNYVIWSFRSSTLFVLAILHYFTDVGVSFIVCRVRSADKEGHVILLRLNDGHNSLLRVFVGKFYPERISVNMLCPCKTLRFICSLRFSDLVVQASLNAAPW